MTPREEAKIARLKAEIDLLKHKLKQSDDKAKKQDEVISNLHKQIEILKHEPKKIKRKRA